MEEKIFSFLLLLGELKILGIAAQRKYSAAGGYRVPLPSSLRKILPALALGLIGLALYALFGADSRASLYLGLAAGAAIDAAWRVNRASLILQENSLSVIPVYGKARTVPRDAIDQASSAGGKVRICSKGSVLASGRYSRKEAQRCVLLLQREE